jgi:hypothetical protein
MAVEKIKNQKSFTRSYRPVVIWLDDLEEIFSLLKEAAKDVQISTEDYHFTSIDKLKEHYGSLTQFVMDITSSSPYVSIHFARSWMTVRISPGAQSAQLFHEIDAILARRQRSIFYSWWCAVPVVLFGAAPHFFPAQALPIVAVQSALLSWYVWVVFIGWRRTAVINLQRRSEARPFFQRNKDQLALLLIGSVIGGLVTFAGIVVKERFYPSAPTVNESKPPS